MATSTAITNTPTSVQIGPFSYAVEFDGETSYDYDYLGVCLNRSRRFKLDPRQSDTEIPQTLLHEILHALGCAYEVPEWRSHKTDGDGRITDKIDLMATALIQLLRDNKSLVQWLQNTNGKGAINESRSSSGS